MRKPLIAAVAGGAVAAGAVAMPVATPAAATSLAPDCVSTLDLPANSATFAVRGTTPWRPSGTVRIRMQDDGSIRAGACAGYGDNVRSYRTYRLARAPKSRRWIVQLTEASAVHRPTNTTGVAAIDHAAITTERQFDRARRALGGKRVRLTLPTLKGPVYATRGSLVTLLATAVNDRPIPAERKDAIALGLVGAAIDAPLQ